MTLYQLMGKLAEKSDTYAREIAELQAAGEPVRASAEQVLLAELAGFSVDLCTGEVSKCHRPAWVAELGEPVQVAERVAA
jgi:hypothetical protein